MADFKFMKSDFDGKKFHNYNRELTNSFSDFLTWQKTRKKGYWPKFIETKYLSHEDIEDRIYDGIKITYINHVTFLIQVNGINIITDPLFSERCSPIAGIGPRRVHKPAIEMKNLPKIDFILISHDHYDHLDIKSINKLCKKFNPKILAGLKISKVIKNRNLIEMDWFDMHTHEDLEFIFTPSHHWSKRKLFEHNNTLWGGFVIRTKHGNIYFAGDTAYEEIMLTKIKDFVKEFKISLLPIGAYLPRWFMKASHMDPEDAIKAHNFLNSEYSIAMHFNTFPLADDGFDEAKNEMKKMLQVYNISEEKFIIPEVGKITFRC